MTKRRDIAYQAPPWAAKDYPKMGITMIVMGLLVILSSLSTYRHGSEAQIVSTKWGTEVLNETPSGRPVYVFLAACGGALSCGGAFVLGLGMLKKK